MSETLPAPDRFDPEYERRALIDEFDQVFREHAQDAGVVWSPQYMAAVLVGAVGPTKNQTHPAVYLTSRVAPDGALVRVFRMRSPAPAQGEFVLTLGEGGFDKLTPYHAQEDAYARLMLARTVIVPAATDAYVRTLHRQSERVPITPTSVFRNHPELRSYLHFMRQHWHETDESEN